MEVIEKIIEYSRPDTFHLFPIGDSHLGSIHSAESDLQLEIEQIANTQNALMIGMGDYADCILKNDKRFDIGGLATWLEKDNIVESQRKKVVSIFEPIKPLILGMLAGNHEESIHLHNQDNIAKNICTDLGVPYAGYSCFFVLTFKRTKSNESHQYVIHAWHGSGAAQTEGARLMRLMRLVNEIQAHIYLMGHLHAMTQHTPDRLVCLRGRVKSIKLAATITGSWLTAYTQARNGNNPTISYAEMKGYLPSRIGCPVIHINPDKDEFSIES
jgi:hypothetical protein